MDFNSKNVSPKTVFQQLFSKNVFPKTIFQQRSSPKVGFPKMVFQKRFSTNNFPKTVFEKCLFTIMASACRSHANQDVCNQRMFGKNRFGKTIVKIDFGKKTILKNNFGEKSSEKHMAKDRSGQTNMTNTLLCVFLQHFLERGMQLFSRSAIPKS